MYTIGDIALINEWASRAVILAQVDDKEFKVLNRYEKCGVYVVFGPAAHELINQIVRDGQFAALYHTWKYICNDCNEHV